MRLRLLSSSDIQAALPMKEAVGLMKEVFKEMSSGQAVMPLRTGISVAEESAIALFMPVYLKSSRSLGAKIISVFPHNPERGLPLVSGVVVVLNPETGQPQAILEGESLTALRTGAASGAATDALALPDVERGAVFGSGGQARTQLLALAAVRGFEEIRVYSRRPERVAEFIEKMQPLVEPRLTAAQSSTEAAEGAQVISLATTSGIPVVKDSDISSGCHLNGIGTYTPDTSEVEAATVARARVVVDWRPAAMAEAGDIIQPIRRGWLAEADVAELGEVLAGKTVGRTSPEQITFFKSVGLAAQDLICATYLVQQAEELGLGTVVEL